MLLNFILKIYLLLVNLLPAVKFVFIDSGNCLVDFFVKVWPHRLVARTPPSHGENRGSIPLEATKGARSAVRYGTNLTTAFYRAAFFAFLEF